MIDCQDCLKRRYDLNTGRPDSYGVGPMLIGANGLGYRKQEYFWGDPPACKNGTGCPKQTDEEKAAGVPAQGAELNRRNRRLWAFYLRGRAVGWQGCELDPLTLDNLSIVDTLVRAWERTDAKLGFLQAFGTIAPLLSMRR